MLKKAVLAILATATIVGPIKLASANPYYGRGRGYYGYAPYRGYGYRYHGRPYVRPFYPRGYAGPYGYGYRYPYGYAPYPYRVVPPPYYGPGLGFSFGGPGWRLNFGY
jgi:hypothetical protein